VLGTKMVEKKIDTGLFLIVLLSLPVFITGILTDLKYSDEIFHFWFAKDWFDLDQRPLYNCLVDTLEELGYFRYYVNAPLWHYGLAALGTLWGGFSKNLAQAYQALHYLLLIVNTYLLTRELYGTLAARWSALVVATTPLFVSFGVLFFMDMPIAVWTPLLLLFVVKRRFVMTGIVLAIMFLTKRNAYLLFPSIAALTFVALHPHALGFRTRGIRDFLVLALVLALLNIPDFIFRYNHFGGFIFHQEMTLPQEAIQTEGISSEQSVLPQQMIPPETTGSKTSGVKEINYIPSSMAAQPLNILKYLGVALLLLILLYVVNLKQLFAVKDLLLILPIATYLPLFFVAFKGWLAARYLSPIVPLVAVLVSPLLSSSDVSPFSSTTVLRLRQVVLFLCLLQIASTLVLVYMDRQVSSGEREAINYIKRAIPHDARMLTPDELFFSYYTERATFWRSSPLFVSEFFTLFWSRPEEANTLLKKYGTDYMVIRKERIYDDAAIRYKMGGGFPQSFVARLPSSNFKQVFQNDEVTIWSANRK